MIILTIILTVVNCQHDTNPHNYPIASDSAQQCLMTLNKTGVYDKCVRDSGKYWPDINGHKDDVWVERDFCCQQYDTIDCRIDAINGGKYCTGQSAQDAIKYLQRMINHWSYGTCMTVPHHSNLCYQGRFLRLIEEYIISLTLLRTHLQRQTKGALAY